MVGKFEVCERTISALAASLTCICMLDWPEQSQTSPTRMLLIVSVVPSPVIVIVNGPPAACGLRCAIHLPSWPAVAVAVAVCPSSVTETVAPAVAMPQTGIAMSRCRTALSVKRLFGVSSARSAEPSIAQTARAKQSARAAFFPPRLQRRDVIRIIAVY
jgi:hypothetical protein